MGTKPNNTPDYCLSGENCLNSDPGLRPTKLALEGGLSMQTHYCSYCRRRRSTQPTGGSNYPIELEGINVINLTDHMPQQSKPATQRSSSTLSLDELNFMLPPELPEIRKSAIPINDPATLEGAGFSQEEYDNFDPDAPLGDMGSDGSKWPSAEALPATMPVPATEAPAEITAPKAHADKTTVEITPPKTKRTTQPSAKKGRSVRTGETFAPNPKVAPGQVPKVRDAAVNPPKTKKAPEKTTKAAKPKADNKQKKPSGPRVSAAAGVKAALVKAKAPLTPRPVQIAVPTPHETAPVAQVMVPLARPSRSSWERIRCGTSEVFRGTRDVAMSAGLLTWGVAGVAAFVASVPWTILSKGIRLHADAIGEGIRNSFDRILRPAAERLMRPFGDHRRIPATGFSLAATTLAAGSLLSYPVTVGLLSGSTGVMLGYVVWRGFYGVSTGPLATHLKRDWRSEFVPTDRPLTEEDMNALDERFTRTVARAFADIGLRATITPRDESGAMLVSERLVKQAAQSGVVSAAEHHGLASIDIVLTDADKKTSVVACRRYGGPCGFIEVRDICEASRVGDLRGATPIVATTTGFTATAVDYAQRHNVRLILIGDLMRLAEEMTS